MKKKFFILLLILVYHNNAYSTSKWPMWCVVLDAEQCEIHKEALEAIKNCNVEIFLKNFIK